MRRLGDEHGGTLVEFAMVATIVLTVIFGLLETGRLVFTYVTIAHAARTGARYAIVHGANRTGSGANGPSNQANYSQVAAVVQAAGTAAGLTLAAPAVTYSPASAPVGGTALVLVSYDFTPIAFVSGLSVTISSQSQGAICY